MSHADELAAHSHETRPRARVDHTCSACDETIKAGTVYTRIGVIFDGSADTVKHCGRCRAIFRRLCEESPQEPIDFLLDCGESWRDTFGVVEPDDVAALAFMLPHEDAPSAGIERGGVG